SGQLLYGLNDLLLVYEDSIGLLQNGLQFWMQIGNRLEPVFSSGIGWNHLHRPWAPQANDSDQVLERRRLHFFDEFFHQIRFDLENGLSISGSQQLVNFVPIQIESAVYVVQYVPGDSFVVGQLYSV